MKQRQWKKLFEANIQLTCPYCLQVIKSRSQATKDHVLPKSRFPHSTKIVWCCKKCNHEKGSLTPEEYIEWKRLEALRNGVKLQKGKEYE